MPVEVKIQLCTVCKKKTVHYPQGSRWVCSRRHSSADNESFSVPVVGALSSETTPADFARWREEMENE